MLSYLTLTDSCNPLAYQSLKVPGHWGLWFNEPPSIATTHIFISQTLPRWNFILSHFKIPHAEILDNKEECFSKK